MKTTYYFDNAATTFPKPELVYSEMDSFYRNFGVNVGRGQHKLSSVANSKVEETRKLLLELFNCPNKKVVFSHTATEALNLVLSNIVKKDFSVYISPFEHNAVTRTLNALQQKYKFNIVILPFDVKKWEYDYERIEYLFECNHPDVVILSHASNVCGFINPYFELFSRAKKYNTKTVLDMCQTAGLVETDLSTEYVDYAIFDGHKTLYGPLGIAGVVGASFENFEPLIYGGTGIDSANSEMPNMIPTRFEAGSTNILAISGLNAALTWIKKVGVSNIRETENKNLRRLLDLLNQYSNIDIIAPEESEKFIGVISCVFKGYSSDNIGNILSENNIAVRTGLHCSPLAHKTLGTFPAGTVRFSIGYFNDEEDFASLERVLEYIDENS